jgi:hypothetical protein
MPSISAAAPRRRRLVARREEVHVQGEAQLPKALPMTVAFALSLLGCAEGTGVSSSAGDTGGGGPSGSGASSGGTAGAAGSSGGRGATGGTPTGGSGNTGGSGPAGACDAVCGEKADPSENVGRSSFAPPGCSGAKFSRSFVMEISSTAGKVVPQGADLDGDGNVDLLLNARVTSSAMVLKGDGLGTFGSGQYLPSGGLFAGGWGVDLGDYDSDGLLDVAAGDHASGAIVWHNDGDLSFSLAKDGLPSTLFNGVGLADVTGDGNLDALFGADQFSSGFQLLVGDGNGSWTPQVSSKLNGSAATNAGYIAFADYDDDGDQDVFAFGQGFGGVSALIFANENDGTAWTEVTRLDGGSGSSVGSPVQGSLGDANCDGAPDVASGGSVFLSTGSGWDAGTAVNAARLSHFGDMNGDGALDLVTHSEELGLKVYLNDGTGKGWSELDAGLPDQTYEPPETAGSATDPLSNAYGIDLVDVNNDGKLDIVRAIRVGTGALGDDARCFLEVWVRE